MEDGGWTKEQFLRVEYRSSILDHPSSIFFAYFAFPIVLSLSKDAVKPFLVL